MYVSNAGVNTVAMWFLRRRHKHVPTPRAVPAGFEPRPSHWDAQEQAWRDGIAEHGWLVIDVEGSEEGQPGFQFTVGLTEHDLPELITYGLGAEAAMHALNDVAERLLSGEQYEDGQLVPDVLEGGYRTQLWDVTWLQDPLGAAFRLYGRDRVRVRQLIIPDLQDRLPWEDGFAYPELQPVLFVPPNGRGPRRAGPEPVRDEDVNLEDWDLPQDPHLGVLTTGYVAAGDLPVLLVVQDEEDEWQFVDAVHEPDEDTAQLMCLHHLVEQDATLRDVLRTLPPHHEAHRDTVGSKWQFVPSVED